MKKIFDWFVRSSKDPEKLALTVKGFVPLLVFLGALWGVNAEGVDEGVGIFTFALVKLAEAAAAVGAAVAGTMAAVGFVRKVYISLKPAPKPPQG